MNTEEYFKRMTNMQLIIEEFLIKEENQEESYENLSKLFATEQIFKNKMVIESLLFLLRSICRNHNRQKDFFHKVEQIIIKNKPEIKDKLTNAELFDIFKNEKLILLFLLEEKIINIDQPIFEQITKGNFVTRKYPEYFYREIKQYIKEDNANFNQYTNQTNLLNFDQYRHEGENEHCICKLIRDDSIEEFIIYINKNNYSLNSEIERSIFETNSFLLKETATLIEYAAFYGSIQIFKYLYLNKANISGKIWLYAVHSDNPELIGFLEDNKIEPEDETYQKVLKESIKCHHHDVTNYIIDKFIEKEDENNYDENIYCYGFHYRNYLYFPKDMNYKFIFFYACQYNYISIVKNYMKDKSFNINDTISISSK